VKATEVTAGPAESNGSLLPGLWRDSRHVTCGLTACPPGSAPGPTLGNEYGKTLPFYLLVVVAVAAAVVVVPFVGEICHFSHYFNVVSIIVIICLFVCGW